MNKMSRAGDIASDLFLFALWIIGLLAMALGETDGAKITGGILWLGIGLGHHMRKQRALLEALLHEVRNPPKI